MEMWLKLHDTPDELDHSISNTAESPDKENLQRYVGSRVRMKGVV